jgi:RNA-directed DNA polymerase
LPPVTSRCPAKASTTGRNVGSICEESDVCFVFFGAIGQDGEHRAGEAENLRERLAKFGLELHPDKTRRIEFGRFAEENRRRRGEGKPETFDFLGFTHITGKNSLGRFMVRRKTIRKRTRQAAKSQAAASDAHARSAAPNRKMAAVGDPRPLHLVRGTRNLATLGAFRDRVLALWWRTLRRRSQRPPLLWPRILELAS